MLYSENTNPETDISADETETNTYIITGSLEDGDYTLEAEDTWSTGQTSTDSYSFEVTEDGETQETENGEESDENGDENGDSDGENGDDESSGDENGNGEEEDDETITEADSGTDTTSTEDEEDEETEDETTTGTEDDGECPEGTEWNEENEVCVETEDTSTGALNTATEAEIAGIPVWLITVLIAFAGIQIYWWKN